MEAVLANHRVRRHRGVVGISTDNNFAQKMLSENQAEYHAYLQSEAWLERRNARLAIANHRCPICGTRKNLQVHHLTYKRIFQEPMEDLLPLCSDHHEIAEGLIKRNILKREGHPLWLLAETVRELSLVSASRTRGRRTEITSTCRNSTQRQLLSQTWFVDALKLKRQEFKRTAKQHAPNGVGRGLFMSNAMTLYARRAFMPMSNKYPV